MGINKLRGTLFSLSTFVFKFTPVFRNYQIQIQKKFNSVGISYDCFFLKETSEWELIFEGIAASDRQDSSSE